MIKDAFAKRRSIYALTKNVGLSDEEIQALVEDMVKLVPDAFNMKSQKIVLALGKKHDELWDAIYDVFGGKVSREKIDSFKAGYGTVLFFYDQNIVKSMQEQFSRYADNFPIWANQSNGMLQLAIWSALAEKEIGASLQHYNPVIDDKMKELFNVPKDYVLLAQMPFGGIDAYPDAKDEEVISDRVKVFK